MLKLIAGLVVAAVEKHAAFVRARGRHYSGEAEAMRRAKQLLDKEEDEDDKMGGGGGEEVEEPLKESIPGAPKVNGT
jgi:protein phosphatase inhibitor 2